MGEKGLRELEKEIAETRKNVLDMMDRTRQELESFREELKKIRKELKEFSELLVDLIAFSERSNRLSSRVSDILLAIRALRREREPGASEDMIRAAFQDIGRFVSDFSGSPHFTDLTFSTSITFVGMLITASHLDSGISFDEFASILLETLPSEVAKKIVPLEDITKCYGSECAIKWKKLLGIQ